MKTIADIVADNLAGRPAGIASWCTAHAETLSAIFSAHCDGTDPILIEATCNQVNQNGGYTGMTPKDFRRFAEGLARDAGIDAGRIIFGGDHLGPNPWKGNSASSAMSEALTMVRDYAEAGFSKIHLDASMACADDGVLSETTMAERAAELCAVAEQASGRNKPCYVIGTEVPIPGGETQVLDALAVTRPEAALNTYELHREAFTRRGLGEAFSRVAGIVVQPGVDFGNSQIFAFDRARAGALSRSVIHMEGVVFEAHSTDYQSQDGLRDLVQSHFAILKVGPELTFAYREAVMAMVAIEAWLKPATPSRMVETMAEVMDAEPRHWRGYVADDDDTMRIFGLSDRIRYYWPNPQMAAAVRRLRLNIDANDVPPGLVWQYAGHLPVKCGGISLSAQIIQNKVGIVAAKYRSACGSI